MTCDLVVATLRALGYRVTVYFDRIEVENGYDYFTTFTNAREFRAWRRASRDKLLADVVAVLESLRKAEEIHP